MILEMTAMSGLIGVIVAKFFTTKNIHSYRKVIATTQVENNKVKGALKLSESTRAAAIRDLKKEERTLRTLRLKVEKFDKDIASFSK